MFFTSQTKAPFLAFQPLNTTRWGSGIHHHRHHVTTRRRNNIRGKNQWRGAGSWGDEIPIRIWVLVGKTRCGTCPFPVSIPLSRPLSSNALVQFGVTVPSLTPPSPSTAHLPQELFGSRRPLTLPSQGFVCRGFFLSLFILLSFLFSLFWGAYFFFWFWF